MLQGSGARIPGDQSLEPAASPIGRRPDPHAAGRPAGYPVVVTGMVPEQRAADMLRYLRDGRYLDPRETQRMTGG